MLNCVITMWKDIKNYEGLYEVSDNGEVRNPRTKGFLLKGILTIEYI